MACIGVSCFIQPQVDAEPIAAVNIPRDSRLFVSGGDPPQDLQEQFRTFNTRHSVEPNSITWFASPAQLSPSLEYCHRFVEELGEQQCGVWIVYPLPSVREPRASESHSMFQMLPKLPGLRRLGISGAKMRLSSEMSTVGKLETIESLFLSGTGVTEKEVHQISGLKNLQSLDVSFTNVSDEAGEIIFKFTKLRSLNISGTRVSTQFVAGLSKSNVRLGTFKASRVNATEESFLSVARSLPVNVIDVSGTKCGDEFLSYCLDSTKMSSIDVSGCKVSSESLRKTAGSICIEKLVLSDTEVGDESILGINRCEKLKSINLGGCKLLTQVGVLRLKINQLSEINLSNTNISVGVGEFLSSGKNLQVIDVSDTGCTNKDLAGVGQCRQLVVLNLSNTAVDCSGIASLRKCSNIEVLLLGGLDLRGDLSASLGDRPHLKILFLDGSKLSAGEICHVIRGCPDLQEVHVGGAALDDCFFSECLAHKTLRTVGIAGCSGVTVDGISNLMMMPKLSLINLSIPADKKLLADMRRVVVARESYVYVNWLPSVGE